MDDRKLDALVAEKVMGWTRHVGANKPWQMLPPEGSAGRAEGRVYSVPHFSIDIAAAWQVVEKLEPDDFWFSIVRKTDESVSGYYGDEPVWHAKFRCVRGGTRKSGLAIADTAPKAICLAALRAVGVEVDDGQ